jgi:hypothetical protein
MVAWFERRDESRLGAVVAATAPKLRSEMASKPMEEASSS